MANPPDHIIVNGKRYDHAPALARRFGYTPQGFCRCLKKAEQKALLDVRHLPAEKGTHSYVNTDDFQRYRDQRLLTAVERAKRWLLSDPVRLQMSSRSLSRIAEQEKQPFALGSICDAKRLLKPNQPKPPNPPNPPPCAKQLGSDARQGRGVLRDEPT